MAWDDVDASRFTTRAQRRERPDGDDGRRSLKGGDPNDEQADVTVAPNGRSELGRTDLGQGRAILLTEPEHPETAQTQRALIFRDTLRRPGAIKTTGYLVSSASVGLLGLAAFPGAEEAGLLPVLFAGMATSLIGMVLRWRSYQLEKRGKAASRATARRRRTAARLG
jgi:hypothetical protein